MIIKIQKRSILDYQLILLLLIGFFNILHFLFPEAVSVTFVFVFIFTFIFFVISIRYSILKARKNTLRRNILYYLLFFWLMVMLINNFKFDYVSLRELVISPYAFLPYLLPFVVFNLNYSHIDRIVKTITVSNYIYVILVIIYIFTNSDIRNVGFVEEVNKYFSFPNFFLLFIYFKLNKQQKFISFSVFLIGFLISVFTGRRSLTWVYSWALIFFIYLNYFNANANILKKIRFFFILLLTSFSLFWGYEKYSESFLGRFVSRINEDTRSSVENDFLNDMNFNDWTFGKGVNGTYKLNETDFLYDNEDNLLTERNIIESGYQNLFLHGGPIYFIIYFIIIIIAIYKGFFKSKNIYGKPFAFFILLFVLESYPAGILTFNMRFFLLWICIFACWDNLYLKKTDYLTKSQEDAIS